MFYYIYVIPHGKNSVKHNRLKTSCVLWVAYFLGTVAHYLCILIYELPLWLTFNFPNLCIYSYIRTYTVPVAPACPFDLRGLWRVGDTFYLIRASAWRKR